MIDEKLNCAISLIIILLIILLYRSFDRVQNAWALPIQQSNSLGESKILQIMARVKHPAKGIAHPQSLLIAPLFLFFFFQFGEFWGAFLY